MDWMWIWEVMEKVGVKQKNLLMLVVNKSYEKKTEDVLKFVQLLPVNS